MKSSVSIQYPPQTKQMLLQNMLLLKERKGTIGFQWVYFMTQWWLNDIGRILGALMLFSLNANIYSETNFVCDCSYRLRGNNEFFLVYFSVNDTASGSIFQQFLNKSTYQTYWKFKIWPSWSSFVPFYLFSLAHLVHIILV